MEMVTDLQLLRIEFNKKPSPLYTGEDVTLREKDNTDGENI